MKKRLIPVITAILIFFFAFFGSRYYKLESGKNQFTPLMKNEFVLIFYGCSTCPAATNPSIPKYLEIISNKVKQNAESKNYGFRFIGISDEANLKDGFKYLTYIADFNEVSFGSKMANVSMQKYIWEEYDNSLSAATPQIIFIEREYTTQNKVVYSSIRSEKILGRVIGLKKIEAFSKKDVHELF
jgi:hypothetical protein